MEKEPRKIDDEQNGRDQSECRSSSSRHESQEDVVDASQPNDVDQALEDAQLILGRNVAFSIVPDDDSFDAQEFVERLSNSSTDSTMSMAATATICIPENKVTHFHEALREYLARRAQEVVESAGRISFWKGREPFIRPVLSRSLSLP